MHFVFVHRKHLCTKNIDTGEEWHTHTDDDDDSNIDSALVMSAVELTQVFIFASFAT